VNVPLVQCRPSAVNPPATKVMILVVDGVSLTTVSATLEPLQHANLLLRQDRFALQLVSLADKTPKTQAGIPVPCHTSSEEVMREDRFSEQPDLVILCCGQTIGVHDQALLQAFSRKLMRASVNVFALGAACAAVAATGMIKGGKCAAHWTTIAPLSEQFPELEFENVLFTPDGPATSCAGEFASFDLIVNFIERECGRRISGEICNHFLASGRRSGGSVQLLNGDALICDDDRFQSALEIMLKNIENPIPTAEIARRLDLSRRQIERIFARYGFEPPYKYYITLRLNRARQLVEQTRMSLIEIAVACGFKSQSSFAKNYKRKFGTSPKSCRGHVGSRPRTAPNTALTR